MSLPAWGRSSRAATRRRSRRANTRSPRRTAVSSVTLPTSPSPIRRYARGSRACFIPRATATTSSGLASIDRASAGYAHVRSDARSAASSVAVSPAAAAASRNRFFAAGASARAIDSARGRYGFGIVRATLQRLQALPPQPEHDDDAPIEERVRDDPRRQPIEPARHRRPNEPGPERRERQDRIRAARDGEDPDRRDVRQRVEQRAPRPGPARPDQVR